MACLRQDARFGANNSALQRSSSILNCAQQYASDRFLPATTALFDGRRFSDLSSLLPPVGTATRPG
jgi:hypothetical protein